MLAVRGRHSLSRISLAPSLIQDGERLSLMGTWICRFIAAGISGFPVKIHHAVGRKAVFAETSLKKWLSGDSVLTWSGQMDYNQ